MRRITTTATIPRFQRRRGVILPLVAFCSIALFGFLALAIDLGMIAAAKTQAQNAADAAAMSGARTLDGFRPSGTAQGAAITTADNHYAEAGPNAQTAGKANQILGSNVTDSQLQTTIGKYIYDVTQSKFLRYGSATDPMETNQIANVNTVHPSYSWSLSRATVQYNGKTFFGKLIQSPTFSLSASATAVHRPRDVAVIMDYSGSMSFDSQLGLGRDWTSNHQMYVTPTGWVENRFSNNPDTLFPKFGHYSDQTAAQMSTANAQTVARPSGGTENDDTYAAANWTVSNTLNKNRLPILEHFYQAATTNPSSPAAKAFADWGAGNSEGTVNGDNYLKLSTGTGFNNGSTPAKTVQEVVKQLTYHANWETNGYAWSSLAYAPASGAGYRGFIEGPRYFGKTFFIWPPDPRPSMDWRKRFFLQKNSSGQWVVPLEDNALLWTSAGNWRSPRYTANPANPSGWPNTSSTYYATTYPSTSTDYYRINYEAILNWLFSGTQGRNPFPTQLRAGRIVYYDAIPYPVPTGLNARWWSRTYNSLGGSSYNERFWKEFIDHALGLEQTGSTTWRLANSDDLPSIVNYTGYGRDFTWGTVKITPNSTVRSGAAPYRYMAYDDNPKRPRTHFWFGPLMMADFIYNQNLGRYRMAGTLPEQPLFSCKKGMQGALRYIEKNHPNDSVGLLFFDGGNSGSRFRRPRVSLGKDYQRMFDSLWFHPDTLGGNYSATAAPRASLTSGNGPIRMYDMGDQVPYAGGGTNYTHPMMLAYNQFSENSTLRTYNPNRPVGDAGGNGRRGAQKLVVFITDGQPNSGTSPVFNASLHASGSNNSYYSIRYRESGGTSDTVTSAGGGSDNNPTLRAQIYSVCTQLCASSTASNPGFSTTRKPLNIHCIGFGSLFAADSAERQNACQTLQQMEIIGKVQGPETDYPTPPSNWLPDWKMITGTDAEVEDKIVTAVSNVMRSGFQLSLIE